MIHIVYFSQGTLRGYGHPINYLGGEENEDIFWKNMIEEGAKREGNVVKPDVPWTAMVVNGSGTPIKMYEKDRGITMLVKRTKAAV